MNPWEDVQKALAELHSLYYQLTSDIARHRKDVEEALERLMVAYDAYLS